MARKYHVGTKLAHTHLSPVSIRNPYLTIRKLSEEPFFITNEIEEVCVKGEIC